MQKDNYLDLFDKKQKAVDHCLWLNFKYRIAGIRFGVIDGPDNNFAVCEEATAREMEMNLNVSADFLANYVHFCTTHYKWQFSLLISR